MTPDEYYCHRQLRNGPCTMRRNHRGRCSTVTFYCDVCGKIRRGTGIAIRQRISYDETEHVADMCFLCQRGIG